LPKERGDGRGWRGISEINEMGERIVAPGENEPSNQQLIFRKLLATVLALRMRAVAE
jgi:hypothetical protein